ncbi:MAG: hypothetical protein NZ937_05715 [Armatimonadetes bacterium]|nr:hypothetical protein [Armatimonadota bacterium]
MKIQIWFVPTLTEEEAKEVYRCHQQIKKVGVTSRLDYCPIEENQDRKIVTPVGVPYELAKNLSEGRTTALPKNLKAY